jgi:hypothetical protein
VKIIIDKISGGPPHGFSKRDVHLFLSDVPKEWLEGVRSVRLLNSLPNNSNGPVAMLALGDLMICSRQRPRKTVMAEALNQLAGNALGILGPRGRLTEAARAKLRPVIEPVLIAIENATTPRISLAGFKELKPRD